MNVTKGDSPKDDEIQAITGATITSNAIANAVNTASDFYDNVIKNGGEAKLTFSPDEDVDSKSSATNSKSKGGA